MIDPQQTPLSQVIVETNLPNLQLLCVGRHRHYDNQLFNGPRIVQVIDDIAAQYENAIIIIDSPPTLSSHQTRLLSKRIGQTLFVVEANKTPARAIRQSLAQLKHTDNTLLMLNKTHNQFSHAFNQSFFFDFNHLEYNQSEID